jgi:methyl-accepting chemotaxis protein
MEFSFSKIGRKFAVPTLVISVLLLNGLGWFMAGNSNKRIRETLDIRANTLIDFITKFSADYFMFFDFSDFENIKKAITSDPDVEFFVIYNDQREPLTEDVDVPEDTSHLMIFEREIMDGEGNVLGFVKMGYNKDTLLKVRSENNLIVFLSIMVVSVLLAFSIMLIAHRVIIRRVNLAVRTLRGGEGDLTSRLDVDADDELGEMASRFNGFVEAIHKIVLAVRESVDKVSVASSQLSSTAEVLEKGSSEQARQTEQISAAMAEMAQTIVDVAKNAGEASDASHGASETAAVGRDEVEKALNGMLGIAETVKEASRTIGDLGRSSSEIGHIINVINEIADQTNLLALNAAIEAARAGDHGRGFAVVADEVRKLAERTGKATNEITGMIEKIQADTERSVSSMDAGGQEVQSGVDVAQNAMNSLETIVSESHKGKDMVQRIAVASEEQSTAAEEVSRNMESILSVTYESTTSVSQIRSISEELNALSDDLQKMIGGLKS